MPGIRFHPWTIVVAALLAACGSEQPDTTASVPPADLVLVGRVPHAQIEAHGYSCARLLQITHIYDTCARITGIRIEGVVKTFPILTFKFP